LALLAGCQSSPIHGPVAAPAAASLRAEAEAEAEAGAEDADPSANQGGESATRTDVNHQPEDLWERIRLDLSWQTLEEARVDKAREHYLQQPALLPLVADRANYYLYYIVEEVQKRDMPVEIAFIPVVESTMDPFALSSSGAAGLWQIMPATGKHLGLEQDSWYDGRQAVRDSTQVALDYLEDLYQEFDEDWLLALAAYNSGAGRVSRARQANERKGLDTDYWSLDLPRQTRNYVPKIIAFAQIVSDPDQFDVEIPEVVNAPAFEVADTGGLLELSRAAELAGVEIDTLRALNPGQLRSAISPRRPSELLLPVGTRDRFAEEVSRLDPEDFVRSRFYEVKPGDSLSKIAQRFNTDVSLLRELNGIKGSLISAGDTLKIPGGWMVQNTSDSGANAKGYQVRRGDSLYGIASRFNITVSDIIAWNALEPGAYLQPGQKLTLYLTDG
jgi:membrane-bound lytic murein transglycosylase D